MSILQFILTAAACLGLWRLCRTQPTVVIAGFLARALLGQALFWISYLQLPFGRSLQLGNGFWFFAIDGPFYLGYAWELSSQGPLAILHDAEQYPSKFFVQVLSLCVGTFGSVASVAILLNCAAYLFTCSILVRVFPTRNKVALAAIACSPASILFSLQPLKDTLFMLLIVALVAAFRRWEEVWRSGGAPARFLACTLAACSILFALSGIRWYFAVIAWGAAATFFVWIALQTNRRASALAMSATLLLFMAQAIRFGASDLPQMYDRLLNPMTMLHWRPSQTKAHLADVRRGFESTPGATTIVPGRAVANSSIAPVAPAPVAPAQIAPASVIPTPGPPVSVAPVPAVQSAPVAPVPSAATVVPRDTRPSSETALIVLPSVATRIITGFAAMFLPRILGESLGVIQVGGGRGLWILAEVDTVLFDLVLLFVIVHCARSLKRGRAKMTATFVFCLLLFLMTAAPMLYAVNNLGTLFRLRMMVVCIAAILPITLQEERDPLLPIESARYGPT